MIHIPMFFGGLLLVATEPANPWGYVLWVTSGPVWALLRVWKHYHEH